MNHFTKAGVLGMFALSLAALPAGLEAQTSDAEAVMIAAGQWARDRVPAGALRLDPHRTGRSTDGSVASRVASALGAQEATLEETRQCTDPMDPATCRLASAALLAIAAPTVRGDEARVRVYAWYRQDDRRAPVGKASWDVTLRRTSGGWVVAGESRLE